MVFVQVSRNKRMFFFRFFSYSIQCHKQNLINFVFKLVMHHNTQYIFVNNMSNLIIVFPHKRYMNSTMNWLIIFLFGSQI